MERPRHQRSEECELKVMQQERSLDQYVIQNVA